MRRWNGAARRVAPLAAALLLATSGVAAVTAGLAPTGAWADDAAVSAQADASYQLSLYLNDPTGTLPNQSLSVTLGETIDEVLARYSIDYTAGQTVTFNDGTVHTFQGWTTGFEQIAFDKELAASDFRDTGSNGIHEIVLTARWTGATTLIAASNASEIPANGRVDASCIDAWQAFCDRIGGAGANEYPIAVNTTTLNAAQQQAYDTHLANGGFEGLKTVDIAFDEYLTDGSDGTLDVAQHDLAASDGVTFDLTFYGLEDTLGVDDLTDVWAMRLPEDGGEPETMSITHDASGNLVINNMTATGTYAFYTYKNVAEPWGADGSLLPYTIENGVMTFPDHPELGSWYQLTVEADEGISFSNPGGGTAWTMTIDAAALDEDDPLFSSQPDSGIYFVRGDGQGMSTDLLVTYPADKALSYELSQGAGTISRAGGPNTLSINLSAPSTLKLRAASETVIANEDGAMLTHQAGTVVGEDGSSYSDDAIWSMLTLVTDWLGGDVADAAGSAINTAIAGVTKMYVYDIHLEDPLGAEFTIPEGDQVTVTLPVPADMSLENLHVFHVADDGTVTDMNATVNADAGTVSFTTSHFSTFVLANVAGSTGGTGSTADSNAPSAGGTLAETGDAALIACAGAALSGLAGAGLVGAGFKRRK